MWDYSTLAKVHSDRLDVNFQLFFLHISRAGSTYATHYPRLSQATGRLPCNIAHNEGAFFRSAPSRTRVYDSHFFLFSSQYVFRKNKTTAYAIRLRSPHRPRLSKANYYFVSATPLWTNENGSICRRARTLYHLPASRTSSAVRKCTTELLNKDLYALRN